MQGAPVPGFPASVASGRDERPLSQGLPLGRQLSGAARLAALMIAIGAAYYIGSRVGLALRIPPATTSVMWPPNTIISLALLLTPTRRWGWCLLAALGAHLIVQSGTGWPWPLILGLAATNSLEALIAAGGFRWLAGGEPRIDSLRRVTIFITVVAVAAPLLSSFPDAALVHWFHGEPFTLVLRRRFTGNCLTALTLLPALLALGMHGPRWLREAHSHRLLEAAALAVGFAIVLRVVLATDSLTGAGALSPHPPGVIILPFLLWASVRFGTAGASLTLLTASLAAVYDAIARAPVATPEAADGTILALQLFLVALAIPLLCMAALMEERYRARVLIADRLLFEAMLARLSATFVNVSGPDLLAACRSGLERMGRFFSADAMLLVEFTTSATNPQDVCAWRARHGTSPGDAAPVPLFPWAQREILLEREAQLLGAAPRSADAQADYALLEAAGYRAMLVLPLASSGRVIGGLAFFAAAPRPPWSSEWLNRVRHAAELFGRALARRQADEALRASEAMKSAILAAIAGSVVVLDRHGVIVTANGPWLAAASDQSLTTIASAAAGSFLEACRASAATGFTAAADVVNGVQAVLAGTADAFSLEYRAEPASLDRWFLVSVVPLGGNDRGAVVTHTDTSARKRAELAAQRSREALANATHVSAMSELASSLAHQLNQPLTGILESARAARDLLATPGFEPSAVDERLRDIVTEEARASDVIHRLHDLLWKGGTPERRCLDFNDVVQDVVRVVQSDAVIRRVQLVVSLAPDALPVVGDRAQLAQVLSNLMINGLEAMSGIETDRRQLVVATEVAYGAALFVVRDAGPGPGADPEILFEPFYTTKSTGMGMGLPIARTIVEAHGGRAWGARTPGGVGASFFVSLPLDLDDPK